MPIFVLSGTKTNTLAALPAWPELRVPVRAWSYSKLFRQSRLPRTAFVFGDFDRLSPWELELAAMVYRHLRAAGVRVLNDPARVLQRYALLRRLEQAGVNSFRVWLLETDGLPDRFPVFLRTASAHRGPMSELLGDAEAVRAAAERLVAAGVPAREIMAVEYRAEPLGPVFRKYAAHRVGDRVITSLSVHAADWRAKYGTHGVAGAALYAEERALIERNAFEAEARAVFDLGAVEFGRLDFGVVRGRVEAYEVNTNPTMSRVLEHPFPDRIAADRFWRTRWCEAIEELGGEQPGFVAMDDPVLRRQRRRDRWIWHDRYVV